MKPETETMLGHIATRKSSDLYKKKSYIREAMDAGLENKLSVLNAAIAEAEAELQEQTPLVDKLNLALSKDDAAGVRSLENRRAFRDVLRKAHCFTIDTETSKMIVDFSLAIVRDLDAARQLAIPPFPVTFFQINNKARFARVLERGISITRTAAGEVDGPAVEVVGWLIERHQTQHTAYRISYCTVTNEGAAVMPVNWCWDIDGLDLPWPHQVGLGGQAAKNKMLFGTVLDREIIGTGFCECPGGIKSRYAEPAFDLFRNELAGELRHVWGLLIALGTAVVVERDGPVIDRKASPIVNGKPVFPIETRHCTISLPRKITVDRLVDRAIIGVKKRRHGVRGHWRQYRDADGNVRLRKWIADHERGDERLGRVVKDYRVKS